MPSSALDKTFAFGPRLSKVEKVHLAPDITCPAPHGDKQRCIRECIDAVVRSTARPEKGFNWNGIVDYLVNNHVKLLLSDEQDESVV